MEMFHAFGFSERVAKEACWINEVTFWKPDAQNPENITRHGRVQDTEDGLSEFPHVVLNQARIHDFYLEGMRNSPSRLEPHYGRRVKDVQVDRSKTEYPVTVTLERVDSPMKATKKWCMLAMWSAATVRAAACASPLAASWSATPPTTPGASWTCWQFPTSRHSPQGRHPDQQGQHPDHSS